MIKMDSEREKTTVCQRQQQQQTNNRPECKSFTFCEKNDMKTPITGDASSVFEVTLCRCCCHIYVAGKIYKNQCDMFEFLLATQ